MTVSALYLDNSNSSSVGNASTPDSTANSLTGDIDLRMKVALNGWASGTPFVLASKWDGPSDQSWMWVAFSNTQALYKSTTGTNSSSSATASASFTDGTPYWLRVTSVASSGLTRFYIGTSITSWTQQGTDITLSTGSFFDSTAPVRLGAYYLSGAQTWPIINGTIEYFEMRNGVGGSVVQSFDAAAVTRLGTRNPSSVTAGGPWTINGTLWDWVDVAGPGGWGVGAIRMGTN